MVWIKRNFFLAIGGVLALALLGWGGWILFSGIQRHKELDEKVEALKATLNSLYNSPDPFPSSNNIEAARKEAEKLRDAAAKSKKYFAPIPFEKVTALAFRSLLVNTIDELRKLAAASSIELPNKTYAFSFTVQKDQTSFSPSTYPMVPQQLAEVKALCSLLFDARVSRLGNLRRAKVSDEDIKAAGTDYNNLSIETNASAQVVSSPYEVTFHCYSSELSQILTALNKSPFGLVLKALQVEPEEGVKIVEGGAPAPTEPAAAPPRPARPYPFPQRTNAFGIPVPPNQGVRPPGQPVPPVTPPVVRRNPSDRPVILLNEKRLKVTMLLYVIRPLK